MPLAIVIKLKLNVLNATFAQDVDKKKELKLLLVHTANVQPLNGDKFKDHGNVKKLMFLLMFHNVNGNFSTKFTIWSYTPNVVLKKIKMEAISSKMYSLMIGEDFQLKFLNNANNNQSLEYYMLKIALITNP
ncbi:hypothetical protein IMG5_186970 [Ichthyophthirius multifiliis]|uniref:Uncharacterized protein n=1 Tax=Ichthyophthirius multifiliis TaxID=5932 RepID=G0R3Q3_ICHMU|nr:hypothetical protein IMG5_186970 [Ichthyophthirius multifiliis]EGR27908.1 hypothetical protein IMG5_186970 [Ichthyophthirius multifiliis]|eukprot:XP_004027253.1 hypothetical protein IMG5_186970 [Ichthyophthirius multifiliis]